jgi:hypothetical protein
MRVRSKERGLESHLRAYERACRCQQLWVSLLAPVPAAQRGHLHHRSCHPHTSSRRRRREQVLSLTPSLGPTRPRPPLLSPIKPPPRHGFFTRNLQCVGSASRQRGSHSEGVRSKEVASSTVDRNTSTSRQPTVGPEIMKFSNFT